MQLAVDRAAFELYADGQRMSEIKGASWSDMLFFKRYHDRLEQIRADHVAKLNSTTKPGRQR